MKIAMIIVMFLLLGAFFIISQNELALKNTENISELFTSYKNWFSQLGDNFGHITGEAVDLDFQDQKMRVSNIQKEQFKGKFGRK